jgi:nucleoside 2-deoxyribosyltransferase
MPKVYLAGPIIGHTYGAAQMWRDIARKRFAPDIQCFSPLRGKENLDRRGVPISNGGYPDSNPLNTDLAVLSRDMNDVLTCDLLLVNLLPADRAAIGSCMEIAWACAFRKPIVAVIRPDDVLHDHPLLRAAIGFRTGDLLEAVDIAKHILLP